MKRALLSNFKANKFFRMNQAHFGFSMMAESAANIQREKRFILDSKSVINARTINDGGARWTQFPNHMTEAEQFIFDRVIQRITLKHATDAGKEIQQSGRMTSLRTREQQGQTAANRHTTSAQGQDESIYFVCGLGQHSPPSFVENSNYLVTIQLAELMKENPEITSRLWLSNHWTEYQQETPLKLIVGNTQLNIQYAEKDQKQYLISYADGSLLQWSTAYQEELFVQKDVLPGVAFTFISLLRLLNAKPNPLIKRLYAFAENQDPQFDNVLEQLFNNLMPGHQRLETKIVGYLDINSPFISLEQQTHKSRDWSDKDYVLRHAIKLNDYDLFSGIFENVKDKSTLNLYSLAKSVLDDIPSTEEQKRYFTLLIEEGFAADDSSESNRFIELVIKKDHAELLDFFLGYPVPNPYVYGLKRILHSNPFCHSFSGNFNLVEIACSHCEDVKIFEVLEKYGVDFQKHLPIYLESAFRQYDNKGINHTAIGFLGNKEDLTLRETECINLTPLMHAANMKDLALTRFFIEKLHADVNEPYRMYHRSFLAGRSFSESSDNGQTALHLAAKSGSEEITLYLLSQGANPWLCTVAGERPIDWAKNSKIEAQLGEWMAKYPQATEDTSLLNHKKKVDSHLSHHTKVVVMLTGVNRHGQRYVVLGKRRQGKSEENKSNEYLCFPGGNVDGSDESYEMAALRELKEETSIDVSAIAVTGAAVDIKEIGHFDVNVSHEHKTTKFFMVDVGNYPISIHPSDDLIRAEKVLLKSIQRDDSQALADYISTQGTPILGSNAMFIDNLLIKNSNSLTPKQHETLSEQLNIEYRGYQLLTELLDQSDSMNSGTPEWKQLNHLLLNNAHLMGDRTRSTLALQMTALNSKEGLNLLHDFGIECEYPGKLNGKYETPLAYSVRTDNIELAKHLVSLGASPSYHFNRKFLLNGALKHERLDMYYYLLQIGVTPNQYAPESRAGCIIVPPILCNLVERDKLDLLLRLLSENTILMSMDLTAEGKRNALITAIRQGKKAAAKIILATMRCPILQKEENEGYGHQAKNALDYLNETPELSDIKDICLFLLEHADMNDFLKNSIGPDCVMDEFLPTVDEGGKPTIHFTGSREHLSQIANKIKPYSSTIREDANGKFYMRMGVKRLGVLLDNDEIAEFLLNAAKESMFWKTHTSLVAMHLYKPALIGNLTYLSNENLESWGLFTSPEKLDFYKVFIQESLSLTEVSMYFTDGSSPSALFLADAITNHPCITRLNLSLDKVTNENLDQLIKVASKLPALEEVRLSAKDMGSNDVIRTLQALNQVKDRSLSITIDGLVGNIIPETLGLMKSHHFMNLAEAPYHFNATLTEANFAEQELFFSMQPGERNNQLIQLVKKNKYCIIENDRPPSLNNILIQASHTFNPTQLNISIDKEHLKKLNPSALKRLLENRNIEEIRLISHTIILPFIVNSSCLSTLKKLDLSFVKIKTADVLAQLTQLLCQAKQLQTLTLSYVTIKTDSPQEFEEFCDAVSKYLNLESIILDIKFASAKQEQQFWASLAKSSSLLGFSNSTFKSAPYEKDLAETCKKNLERQKDWVQSIKGSSLHSMFNQEQKRQKIPSTTDKVAPTIWV